MGHRPVDKKIGRRSEGFVKMNGKSIDMRREEVKSKYQEGE
jgi:hypothetical protein